jgi:hypothetical protein
VAGRRRRATARARVELQRQREGERLDDQDQRIVSDPRTPGSGRIDMMANDRSWSGNALFDVTYFESGDGGATWTVRRVTKTSWDPSQYGVPDGSGIRPFIGDYDGIISLPSAVGVTWTGPGKTRGALPTNLEVYFGGLTP